MFFITYLELMLLKRIMVSVEYFAWVTAFTVVFWIIFSYEINLDANIESKHGQTYMQRGV
jgi:hypothetical protein